MTTKKRRARLIYLLSMYCIKTCDLLILFFGPTNLLAIFHREIIQTCKSVGTQMFTAVLTEKENWKSRVVCSTEKTSHWGGKVKKQQNEGNAKNWLTRKDPDAGKDWRQEEKGTTEDEMVGWHHWLEGHEFKQTPGVDDGQGDLECYSPWGHKESDTTEWLKRTTMLKCCQY